MTEIDDRRAHGSQRVKVKTLVEICGNQPGVPAFEARSLDVSGRGMHVTTAYVPVVGAPLICRFESQGQEIVVEGVVAWRRESEEGGDFGIEFTALDSGSVDALRSLCGVPLQTMTEEEEPDAASADQPHVCSAGAQVKLHIDGLGSPMKANVRTGSTRRVHVGSNLEFLKVGRHLEIEDLTEGARRSAHIDKVDITVDPRNQIPELVVTLRYEGAEEVTPEPSVVDSASAAEQLRGAPRDSQLSVGVVSSAHSEDDAEARDAEEEMLLEQQRRKEADAVYERFANVAGGAGSAAKVVGHKLADASRSASRSLGSLFRGAGRQIAQMQRERADQRPLRQTAPPVSSTLSARSSQLRVQNPAARAARTAEPQRVQHGPASEPPSERRRRRRLAMAAGALVVVGATTAFALRSVNDSDVPAGGAGLAAAPAAAKVTAKPAKNDAAPKAEKAKKKEESGEIVANVPLFGPTPMATLEPAPLDAPDPEDEEAAEKAAAAASVEDATWSSEANPKDVKPWGRGRMHLPTIHKLRLDGPGGALQGSVNATGFTVVVPGRKVLESGRAIQRRDKRIVQVKTGNQAAGAQISFQFRDGVPAYRVRLREDAVEFLISAPDP